ncbi:MAG: LuxR C-terminal-related transcriptional regulator [Caldilineaceae bacterium]
MMTAALTFGGWLKRRRMSLGLTQKELARQVGYAQVTLRKVEADELRPSGQMAKKLAEALELAPDEQPQFVRFARDEAHWDDLALPGRAPSAPMSTSQQLVPQPPVTIPQQPDIVPEGRRARHNLPALTTMLVGRDEELAELAQLLSDPATRLVTILSAGGMGKTSLAIAAAAQQIEQFPDGVCWVPLAPLTEAKDLVLAIAAALGLQLQGGGTPEQQVSDCLRAKHLLLVLDNFEHLLAGAPLVGELLSTAPQLAILVTSRQRLNLSSEAVIFLDGLRFPADEAADPLAYPAVELFLLHARRLHPGYQPGEDDVAGIIKVCRLVHGIPLGILLAAAWSRVLAPAEIAAEIVRDLGFLQTDMADVPTRQRNLRTVFLHTWSRLSAAAHKVFMCLSVFRGGASAEAARQVTGATAAVLAELIDMALLRRLPNGRYEIHELLRQFAAEELAAATNERGQSEAQQQHSRYYLALLAGQEQLLQSLQQRAALDTIQADFENISIAWRWASRQHEFEVLSPAVDALFLYCNVRGALRAGIDLFAAVVTELSVELEATASVQPILRELWGQLIARVGAGEVLLSNYARGEKYLLDCLPHIQADKERAFVLAYLGQAAAESGELVLARTRLDESVAISRQCNDYAGMAHTLQVLEVGKPFVEAQRLAAESLACARKAGRPDLIATRLNQFGWHTWCLGDYATADACWREGVTLCAQLGLRGENAWPLDCLGLAAWFQGDMETAEREIGEALAIYSEAGRPFAIGMCKAELAMVLASTRRFPQALALAREAVAITRGVNGQMMLIVSLNHLGTVLGASGEFEEARRALYEAVRRAWDCQFFFSLMMAFYAYAELLVAESHNAGLPGSRGDLGLAATLLSCVCTQPAAWQAYKDKAAHLLTLIEPAVPAAVFNAAIQAGRSKTVEELVHTLLASNSEAITDAPQDSAWNGSVQSTDSSSVLFESLTARELTVLRLIAAGGSNHDIADELFITQGTAKWYVSQILGKLGVQSRTQAIARGRELGLLA